MPYVLEIFLSAVTGAILLALVTTYFVQARLIFPGRRIPDDYKFRLSHPSQEIELNHDGQRVHTLLVTKDGAPGTLLYFHGNGGELDSWSTVGDEIVERTGWNVWLIDYPGYGKSEGSIQSENQLHEITEEFFKKAEEMKAQYHLGKLVAFGRSIGTGLAVKLARDEKSIAALIIETPYESLEKLIAEKVPIVPSVIVKFPIPSRSWIGEVSVPILIFHGKRDEVVPYAHGAALAQIVSDRTRYQSQMVTFPEGMHNDLGRFPEYWTELKSFLNKIAAQ